MMWEEDFPNQLMDSSILKSSRIYTIRSTGHQVPIDQWESDILALLLKSDETKGVHALTKLRSKFFKDEIENSIG